MLQAAIQSEFDFPAMRAANDNIGAATSHHLWDLVEPILNCADLSEDRDRYEASIFRFPKEQRLMFAALCYLTVVERQGHEAYFSSEYAMQFEDVLEFFLAAEQRQVAGLVEEASEMAVNGPMMAYATGEAYHPDLLAIYDHGLACLNPVPVLSSFARRHPAAFESW